MNYKEASNQINNELYKNSAMILLQAESIAKIRRYGTNAYFSSIEDSTNGYFTDFMPMFLYLSKMENILSDLDDANV